MAAPCSPNHAQCSRYIRAAWSTFTVNSDLQAIGLIAVFSTALGKAGMSSNVVAGAYHDHVFVPAERAADSMNVLLDL